MIGINNIHKIMAQTEGSTTIDQFGRAKKVVKTNKTIERPN